MSKNGFNNKGGRPPGKKNQSTLEKEEVLKQFRLRVMKAADMLANAQLGLAKGSQYLYKIEKEQVIGPKGGITYRNKKPELVTEQWEIEAYLEGIDEPKDNEATYYFLTTKDPENQAIEALLNRSLGKPTESVDLNSKVNIVFNE